MTTGYEVAVARIEEVARTGARELDLSGLGLTSVPDELIYDPQILYGSAKKQQPVSLISPSRPLNVCLIYYDRNPLDRQKARELRNLLRKESWIDVWFDEEQLLPGQDYVIESARAIRKSDVILLCLSEYSVNTEGYFQHNLKVVYEVLKEVPDEVVRVIPLRLDNFRILDVFSKIQHGDYFPEENQILLYERLLASLRFRAQQLNIIVPAEDSLKSLNVFLCHATEDRHSALALYEQLTTESWINVWLDDISILPGQKWEYVVKEAITGAHIAVICLSTQSITKESFVQEEMRLLTDKYDETIEGEFWVIPVRLNDCKIPQRLKRWQYLDYFPAKKQPSQYDKLLDVMRMRATKVVPERFKERNLNLNSLNLSFNALVNFPSEIRQFNNLIKLELAGNQLHSLPDEFRQLTKLKELNLKGNNFDSLPEEIVQIQNLTSINLDDNHLSDLKSEIGQLINLARLKLKGNQLANLPPELAKLNKLTLLDLSNNQFKNPPLALKNLTNLKTLDIRENPLSVPPEILERVNEPKAIINYLVEVWAGQRRPLAETKMLVVGQGSVGKTSLIRRLTGSSFNSRETKTDGIAINRWHVPNTEKGENQPESLRVNIWDFGGQEIMHATHQFFLTRRSLYMLVLDSRISQEDNRVEYWLKIIQSFGGDSPVLIIGNKVDQHPLDIDKTGLQNKYPNIVGILETSAAEGKGLDELKSAIAEQVNKLPHVRDSLPEVWFNVKNQLEILGHVQNYISQEKYAETCVEGEIRDETSQKTLIGFLHDLGVVLHFQDDPRLETLGILNPQWVTNGVYKILNTRDILDNKGEMSLEMLNTILDSPEYPSDKQLFIVEMMKKFELCYDIDREKFLVPDLLPKSEPFVGEKKEWEGALTFQYHYNVLPSSIITRFIVRMNGFVYKTVWRSGVVLKKDGNMALVKSDTEDKKIFIWVNGDEPTRRDFLSAIRAEFDAIHKTIIKIEAVQKVPHPEYPDLVLDYAELLQFERDNIAEFPRSVDGKTVMVNVRQLLNGVRVGSEPAPVVKSVPPPAVAPVKVETAPVQPAAGNQSLLVKVVHFIFVAIPRAIGHIPLDLVSKGKDAAESTPVLLGYAIIIVTILVLLGVVGLDTVRDWFTNWWRFFYPVKP